jgi:hypothetical protein
LRAGELNNFFKNGFNQYFVILWQFWDARITTGEPMSEGSSARAAKGRKT